MNIKRFVVDQKFNYQEYYRQGNYVNKYYQIEQNDASLKFNTIPDACVDLQFGILKGKSVVCVCGSCLKCKESLSSEYSWCFGVKFNPGKYPMFVSEYMEELIEKRKVIENCQWMEKIKMAIMEADSFEKRINIFEKFFPFESQFSWMNPIIVSAMEMIEKFDGCINIAYIAEKLQHNQRYMDRIFHKSAGLSMKKYATIIQMQTAIKYIQEGYMDDIYEKLGYYDQSYFIKKFKKYTSMTPREYYKKNTFNIV